MNTGYGNKQDKFLRCVARNERGICKTFRCKLDLRIAFSILAVCVCPKLCATGFSFN